MFAPQRAAVALWLLVACAAAAARTPGLATMDQLRLAFMAQTDDLWSDVTDSRWVVMNDESGGADIELLRAYRTLGDNFDAERQPHDNDLPAELGSLWLWARAENELRNIDTLYHTFRRFQIQQTRKDALPVPRRAWTDLAETILTDSVSSIPSAMEKLHQLVMNANGTGGTLYQQALVESGSTLCSLQQSPQQLLYNIYSAAALTELKGYAMMQFSWMLLRIYEKGNFSSEARIMRERYQERTKQKVMAVKTAMASAKRDLYRCDPRAHVEGDTYVQITRLLQGHIQNEVDMNSDNTCRENCAYYSYTKAYGCYHNLYCDKQQRCNGKIVDCKYYDSDMWVCQPDKDSVRRYDWIEYENGRVLGQKSSCRRGTTKVDSWWRWLFWHCSYCFCLCDEQGPKSDRYFNLRPVMANVAENMVVTGLRFVKKNRIIHMQIQEGALLPRGGINTTTLRWRPADDYRITDSEIVSGRDFHTLTWEQRAIDLDDLVAPPGHVLTGFRFRRVGTHLNPEIMSTPLNFSAGTLIKPNEQSVWHSNDNTDASLDKPRTRMVLRDTDVPTRSNAPSLPDSKPEQFVLFTHTGMDADAAQTTVPFLDAQPVSPEPPTLLAGAGLFHKGRPSYGGFIAPKLVTYDFSEHVRAEYPPDDGKFRV